MSAKNSGPKGESNSKNQSKPKQNNRGCKSLSNVNFTNTKPKDANSRPNQKYKATHQHQANQQNAYSDNPPPSYNEAVYPHNPNFNAPLMPMNPPLMSMNTQPFQSGPGFPSNYNTPNPNNQLPMAPPYPLPPHQQFQPQQQFQQQRQQFHPRQQFQHQRQQFHPRQNFQPRQHFQGPRQHQPRQQSSNTTHHPKPMPRTSFLQTENVNQSVPSQQKSKLPNTRIDLNSLVRELSDFNGFFTSVETLSKILNKNYVDVMDAIKSNRKIFSTIIADSKVTVELCPKIGLCHEHIGSSGCTKQKCSYIHICADFVNDDCQIKNCPFGHIWKTDHNNLVLKEFFLSLLPNKNLHAVMKKVLGKIIIPEICPDYLKNECKLDECNKLHICYSYVNSLGNCSDGDDCLLSHNIRDAKCLLIFNNFGISSNESPRDLLKILKDKCLVGGQAIQQKSSCKERTFKSSGDKTFASDAKALNKDKKTQPQTNNTVCCWHFNGDVKKPTICIENISKKCSFFTKGCNYLHCSHKSHWQFGSNDRWYNFHLYHSQFLDTKYNDVNSDRTVLPKLNPTKINNSQSSLLGLMGKGNCKIDFVNMKMDCEEVGKIYDIRHLTTESYAVCSESESTVFNWYFLENDGKWVLYGGSESSSLTIEKAYQAQPTGNHSFKSLNFTYSLDFSNMTQSNSSTGKTRPLRRRPAIKQDGKEDEKSKFKLPKHWEKMNDIDEKMVMLSSGNEEFVEIRQIMRLSLPMINIVNIQRIQNAYLWKQFQNKQTELKKKHNDDLNIQKLFHGIDKNFLPDICRDNLEFRKHDDSSESKPYGDGTYFYNSAGVAAKSSKLDFMGNKTVLVAEVIIGSVALGSQGLTRPPPNPSSNGALFDTTTDSVESPTVFVKFNKQEYYPAYVVEFK